MVRSRGISQERTKRSSSRDSLQGLTEEEKIEKAKQEMLEKALKSGDGDGSGKPDGEDSGVKAVASDIDRVDKLLEQLAMQVSEGDQAAKALESRLESRMDSLDNKLDVGFEKVGKLVSGFESLINTAKDQQGKMTLLLGTVNSH